MKIELTQEHIDKSNPTSCHNCACGMAIEDATGRQVNFLFGQFYFTDDLAQTTYYVDQSGRDIEERNLNSGRMQQKPGWFEIIGYEPPPKNWQYRLQDPRELVLRT